MRTAHGTCYIGTLDIVIIFLLMLAPYTCFAEVANNSNVKKIVGTTPAFALMKNGVVYGYGINDYGELCAKPLEVREYVKSWKKITTDVTGIQSEFSYSLFTKNDGSLWVCGSRGITDFSPDRIFLNKELTIGENSYIPLTKVMDNVKKVASGGGHIMIIKEDLQLLMWKRIDGEVVGPEHVTQFKHPVDILADTFLGAFVLESNGDLWIDKFSNWEKILDNVTKIEATPGLLYALKKDGSLWAYGNNQELSEKEDGTAYPDDIDPPMQLLSDVVTFTVGGSRGFALRKDGVLWAWGGLAEKQPCIFPDLGKDNVKPISYSGPRSWTFGPQPILRGYFPLSVRIFAKKDGSLWTWGDNPAIRKFLLGPTVYSGYVDSYEPDKDGALCSMQKVTIEEGLKLPQALLPID